MTPRARMIVAATQAIGSRGFVNEAPQFVEVHLTDPLDPESVPRCAVIVTTARRVTFHHCVAKHHTEPNNKEWRRYAVIHPEIAKGSKKWPEQLAIFAVSRLIDDSGGA